jgi:hypothetical protein
MVELFKTNITHHFDAIKVKELLQKEFPECTFHFDLSDKDKLLRVEGKNIQRSRVVLIIKYEGFYCEAVDAKNEP